MLSSEQITNELFLKFRSMLIAFSVHSKGLLHVSIAKSVFHKFFKYFIFKIRLIIALKNCGPHVMIK